MDPFLISRSLVMNVLKQMQENLHWYLNQSLLWWHAVASLWAQDSLLMWKSFGKIVLQEGGVLTSLTGGTGMEISQEWHKHPGHGFGKVCVPISATFRSPLIRMDYSLIRLIWNVLSYRELPVHWHTIRFWMWTIKCILMCETKMSVCVGLWVTGTCANTPWWHVTSLSLCVSLLSTSGLPCESPQGSFFSHLLKICLGICMAWGDKLTLKWRTTNLNSLWVPFYIYQISLSTGILIAVCIWQCPWIFGVT